MFSDPAAHDNLAVFQDCVAASLVVRLAAPASSSAAANTRGVQKKRLARTAGRKNGAKTAGGGVRAGRDDGGEGRDAEGLGEFIQYLAEELFANLPEDLRSLSYAAVQTTPSVAERYSLPLTPNDLAAVTETLPTHILDSLETYRITTSPSDTADFLAPILTAYITTVTTAPAAYDPSNTALRPDGCEICSREHLPLTYHHLIPRQMHAKAVKRGWHEEWALNKVAWLCRACHSYVHRVATNEELARELFSVELLMEREDLQKWASWVGRVRWKAR